MSKPTAGDIWRYPYLWSWQAARGETEGRKSRPVTLAAVLPVAATETRLFLLPITGTSPMEQQDALEVPAIEIRRAGLSKYKRLWVIFDDHNRDTLETSFYFEPAGKVGTFSKAFQKQLAARFLAAYKTGGAKRGVDRLK
jgi:hypothetical protein